MPTKLLLIRPAAFAFNPETAKCNAFQKAIDLSQKDLMNQVLREFDGVVEALEKAEIDIKVFQDSPNPPKPDAIFPNNWFSTHKGGQLVIYPMFNPSRRAEVNPAIIAELSLDYAEIIDLRGDFSRALEGTGSLVLDRKNKLAFLALSPRSDLRLADLWAKKLGFTLFPFSAVDVYKQPIYHSNVMMSIAEQYVIICLDCLPNPKEKEVLLKQFKKDQKEVIEISLKQMQSFAANVLQVKNQKGEWLLILSQTAFDELNPNQLERLKSYNDLVLVNIPTIEQVGGGGVRCMLAEMV